MPISITTLQNLPGPIPLTTLDNNFSAITSGLNLRAAYGVVWASSGTQPAIGNGALNAEYCRNFNQVFVRINLAAGTTTTFGTGTWKWSLPFPYGGNLISHGALLYTADGSTYVPGVVWISTTDVNNAFGRVSGPLIGAATAAWGTASIVNLTFTYEVAQ